MAVIVTTARPQALLDTLLELAENGELATWDVDEDGDFTHSPPQWNKKAWMRPMVRRGRLVFAIIKPRQGKISRSVYAVYHGRLIELLLTHADEAFTTAEATAMPTDDDHV